MSESLCDDWEERRSIKEELRQNFFVEAGAGSGKTTAMVDRMVALIENRVCEPSQIVAITFTNQSADHLKQKFQDALEKRIQTSKVDMLPLQQQILEEAYENIYQIFIGTIHSFCLLILREHSLEAGLESSFTILGDREERLQRRDFWNRYYAEQWTTDPQTFEYLSSFDFELTFLEDLFESLCDYSDIEFPVEQREEPDISGAFQKLFDLMKNHLDLLPAFPQKMDSFSQMWHKIREHEESYGTDIPRHIQMDTLIQMSRWGRLKIVQKMWPNRQSAKIFKESVWEVLQEKWLNRWVDDLMAFFYSLITPCLLEAVALYHEHKMKEQELSLSDVLVCVRDLLKNNPSVRREWKEKVKTILVDEFQDTDLLQVEIVLYLSGKQIEETFWKNILPEPGRLFVVGDPKQSIYRFRRADIQLYYSVKAIVKSSGGVVCQLRMNFRSNTNIGDWVNAVFGSDSFFPKQRSIYQAEFMAMLCRQKSIDNHSIYVLESSDKKMRVSEKVREQAKQIAECIVREVSAGQSLYSDFMILTYYSTRLSVYEDVLKMHGIPSLLMGKRSTDSHFVLKDLQRLFEWMNDPRNEFLGYGVLRSLFFGISDTELFRYRKDQKASFILEFKEGEDPVSLAISQVWHWFTSLRSKTALEVLYRIYKEWDLISFCRTVCSSDVEANVLALFLDFVSSQKQRSCVVLSDILSAFETFFDTPIGGALHGYDRDNSDAVRIMNIHQAKGLESKTVFLVDPARSAKKNCEIFLKQSDDNPQGFCSFLNLIKNRLRKKCFVQPSRWDLYEREDAFFKEAEHQRLLYVACTRAKNRLVVSDDCKSVWGEFTPFLDSCPPLRALSDCDEGEVKTLLPPTPLRNPIFHHEKALKDRVSDLAEPSYLCLSVTQENVFDFADKPKSGLGVRFGIWMHRLLENVVIFRKKDLFDMEAFVQHSDPCGEKKEALRQIDLFKSSQLWTMLHQTDRVYTEVPYAFSPQKSRVDVQTGVIDLIFFHEGHWIVVDHKTEHYDALEDDVMKAYQMQISQYAQAWEFLTKQRVKKTLLYFTPCGTVVE